MRSCFLQILLLSSVSLAPAEIRDVMRSSEVDALFKASKGDVAVHETPCCALWFRVFDAGTKPFEMDGDSDRVFFVRRGKGVISLEGGPGGVPETPSRASTGSGLNTARRHEIGPGDLVNIPRGTRYQVDPGKERLEAIEVRVFLQYENVPSRFGDPRPMGDVLRANEMDALFAKFDREQPVYIARNFRIGFVIREAPSAWESHGCCVDIYLPVHAGAAHVLLGGKVENPREQSPGEIRGTGITEAREYRIGPGDLVVIPRAGAHYIDPRPGKIGYLIVKIRAD